MYLSIIWIYHVIGEKNPLRKPGWCRETSSLSTFSLQPKCSAVQFSYFSDLLFEPWMPFWKAEFVFFDPYFHFLVEWAHWLVNSAIIYVETFYYLSKEKINWESCVSKSPDPVQDPTVTYSAHPSSNHRKWEEAASAPSHHKSHLTQAPSQTGYWCIYDDSSSS